MIRKLIIKLAKGYALDWVVDAVNARGAAVAKYAAKCRGIIAKLYKVIAFLDRLAARLTDGVLDNCEAEETIDEAETLAKEVA